MDRELSEKTSRRTPARVLELVGPACAGKTTLTTSLVDRGRGIQVAPDISLRRPEHMAILVRTAPLLPPLLRGIQPGRWLRWEELKSLVYVQGWPNLVRQLANASHDVVVLDQGPVFRLALLHAFGPDGFRKPSADRWWTDRFRQWADYLDLVIWLDAPNAILEKRINARGRWHLVKGRTEREVSEFLDRYRTSYQFVLENLSANGGVKILPFDTSKVPSDTLVNAILAACRAEGNGA